MPTPTASIFARFPRSMRGLASVMVASARVASASVALLLAMAAVLGGCSTSSPNATFTPTGITPIERAVHAVMGQRLVIPVRLGPEVSPAAPLLGRLDDGRTLAIEVHWIRAEPSPTVPQWMPDPGVWSAVPAIEGGRPAAWVASAPGFWALVLDLPLDAVGQGFWLDGRRWPIDWLDHPGFAPAITSPIGPGARASDRFRLFAEVERASPMLRFRSRLIAGELANIPTPGLSPTAAPNGRGPIHLEPDRFDDPIIEALALQQQTRWAAAIVGLRAHDPDLARRLTGALCRAVEIDSTLVPAWPTDPTELRDLLADLLNARRTPLRRARAAARWLDEQPAIIAWVADDAGLGDAVSGHCVATVAAVNVGDETRLVSFNLTRGDIDLQRLDPGEQVRSQLACPPAPANTSRHSEAGAVRVEVVVQGQRWADLVRAEPIAVVPPGAALTPLYSDRRLSRWRGGLADAAKPVQQTGGAAALLMRTTFGDPASSGTAMSAAALPAAMSDDPGTERWALYVECITGDGPIEGSVRLWIGPSDAPVAVLTVHADGRVEEERVRRMGADPVKGLVRVTRRGDRWSCLIPLPRGAIDRRGIVRLGLEHIAADGTRSAWPRPMFPWQAEPARGAFDTTAWGSLSIFGSR